MTTEQSAFWARHNNPHPEPGLPSERAVTECLADAVATGSLPPLHTCGLCGAEYITSHDDCPGIIPPSDAEWLESVRHGTETITEEAQRLVLGDRQDDYGHPAEDFARTGRIWAAILGLDEVTPQQVALCMVGVKMSREVNRPKRDNRVDGIGYWLTDDLIEQRAAGQ